jgi:Rps23 Pro-64 3,4-dihydroxylase Tpa1-like proline 4-hydroxylase
MSKRPLAGSSSSKPAKGPRGIKAARAAATNHKKINQEIDVLRPGLLDAESKQKLKKEHDSSEPYKHLVINDLCQNSMMRSIHNEVKHNMSANFKESDLFKVFQTGELGNLDRDDPSLEGKIDHLFALREAIYSDKFREFIGEVMGCDDLTTRVDCSANAYTQGCHLMCHDDVIGTRRVSYIIYLTDPDSEWKEQDGGSLELYPLTDTTKKTGIPATLPTKCIVPAFNRMALFKVQPGRSYHSVQEVFCDDKPRLSISGWFHGPTPPEGADKASLAQLLANDTAADEKARVDFQPPLESSSADRDNEILKKWINPVYLSDQAIKDINDKFCNESSIQLYDFLKKEVAHPLMESMTKADEADKLGGERCPQGYKAGISKNNGWSAIGPPHKQRYLNYDENSISKSKSSCAIGKILKEVSKDLMASAAFTRFLYKLTALRPIGFREEVRRFRPGLDYTVAHHSILTKDPRLDATLCFVDEGKLYDKMKKKKKKNSKDDEEEHDHKEDLWDSGDVGGFECYISGDKEEAEAAEVFQSAPTNDAGAKAGEEDDDTELLSVTPGANVLNLVMRDECTLRFVKYVSAAAPGSRWDVAIEYELDEMSDSESDEEKEEGL